MAAFPAHGDPVELVQQGEGLFDDVAQFPQALDGGCLRLGDDRLGAALAAGLAEGLAAVSLVASSTAKRRRGWPGRPGIGGQQSSRSRARLMSGMFAPLVST